VSLIRSFYKWSGMDYLKCTMGNSAVLAYPNPASNRIWGSDGLQFPPFPPENSSLPLWFTEIWREMPVQNVNGTMVTKKGITLRRFVIPTSVLQNSTQNPANAAYYQNGFYGLFNATNCAARNVPIFPSKPHFLDADPRLREGVVGLSPDRERHDTFFDVEPNTGVAMSVRKRVQINVHLKPIQVGFQTWFSHLKDVYLPVSWVDGGGDIPDQQADFFKNSVYGAQTATAVVLYAGASVGSVLVVTAALLFYRSGHMEAASKHPLPFAAE